MEQSKTSRPDGRRVVLVTGGATGIGLATARRFAGEGAAVALFDIDTQAVDAAVQTLRAEGVEALALYGSVTDEEAVTAAISRTVGTLGGLDVLVNNAGVSCNQPSLELSLDDWRRAVDINLTGVFLASREAGRHMTAAGGGVIINLGSMYGTVAAPERAGYCATKAGVDMLTRVLAIEWASRGVRINTIAPGYVETALMQSLIDNGRMDGDALKRRTPAGRFADPDEIARVALFLASDAAAFITGQTLGVDGGWTAYGYV